MSTDPIATDINRHLRRHYEGSLLFDSRVAQARFIIDGDTGGLILALEPVALAGSDFVLFVPEERDADAAELMLAITAVDRASGPHAAASDRWEAYHGRTPLRAWAFAEILGAKWNGQVADGDDLMQPDPLAPHAGELVRASNADPDALTAACRCIANVEVAEPLAVGVDVGGIDIRARFGIVRLEFPTRAATVEAARAAITRLLGGGGE